MQWRWLLGVVLVAACGGEKAELAMNFAGAGFWDAPFPSDHRLGADGRADLSGFATQGVPLVEQIRAIASETEGFGLSSGVFFRASLPLDPASLPTVEASLADDAAVFLMNVDPASPDAGERQPVTVLFAADGGRFGAPNLLVVLPVQGRPLRPKTRYAAVVLRSLGDGLAQAPQLDDLLAGKEPLGLGAAARGRYREALAFLADRGIDGEDIAALSVYTTGDPEAGFSEHVTDVLARPIPQPLAPFARTDVFPDFCVYATTIAMPTYQTGTPPYTTRGGGWADEPSGFENANLVVTIPRRDMPAGGFPTVLFSRTGAGGERPLVDRGRRAVEGGEAIEPGSGLGRDFAQVGWAGLSIDGPHGGLRNVTRGDEQFLMFNVLNPTALRDNVRQSALELVLAAHIIPLLEIASADCGGAPALARLDGERLAVFGHSMGAWIAPIAAAVEPRLRRMILSGAGGSWIENILWKKRPLDVRPLAQAILGYAQFELTAADPVLSLLQWAGETADPQVYGRRILDEPVGAPRQVLMVQGIVDHYILPSIANATSLAMGLDLAGPALDEGVAELSPFAPLRTLLPLAGRAQRALPVSGNRDGVTAAVVQHPADGIEDGHEALFQTETPKRQLRCFLAESVICP
jgi:hypothetical protein